MKKIILLFLLLLLFSSCHLMRPFKAVPYYIPSSTQFTFIPNRYAFENAKYVYYRNIVNPDKPDTQFTFLPDFIHYPYAFVTDQYIYHINTSGNHPYIPDVAFKNPKDLRANLRFLNRFKD